MTSDDAASGAEVARHKPHRQMAEWEYELYKLYGRPSGPYYMKCLECGEAWEIGDNILDADHDARWHAGRHSGLYEEDAEVVVTDKTGREVFRHHGLHQPEQLEAAAKCEFCDRKPEREDRVSCEHCGAIPEGARL